MANKMEMCAQLADLFNENSRLKFENLQLNKKVNLIKVMFQNNLLQIKKKQKTIATQTTVMQSKCACYGTADTIKSPVSVQQSSTGLVNENRSASPRVEREEKSMPAMDTVANQNNEREISVDFQPESATDSLNDVYNVEIIDSASEEDLLWNSGDENVMIRYGRTYGPSKRKDKASTSHTKSTTPMVLASRQGSEKIKSCSKCGYTTHHSGHFNLHKTEGCAGVVTKKDKNCPICCKAYTYNQLRYHLRPYLSESSKATNGHQYFSPADHDQIIKFVKTNK